MWVSFIERARARFKHEVTLQHAVDWAELESLGPDAMPSTNPAHDREGRWTTYGMTNAGCTYYFATERDAVEFKLRFG